MIESLLVRPFAIRIGWGLLHSVWEIAAVALVAAVVLGALRHRTAQSRYLAACAALVLMIALPAATLGLVGARRVTPGHASGVAVPGERMSDGAPRRVVVDVAGRRLEDDTPAAMELQPDEVLRPGLAGRIVPLLPWLVAAWTAGVIALSLRLVGGWFLLTRLARRGILPVEGGPAEAFARLRLRLQVSLPVRLLESTLVRVPMVIGWLRPVVLLPVGALTGLTPEQFEAILAHELAHIRRHDYLVNLVQNVIETLLFYHPAVWWVARRIREEREHCCDDWAVATCGDRLVYARALTAMEELRGTSWALAPSACGRPLLARIRRVLGLAPAASRPAGGLAGMVALAAVVGLGLALVVAPGASPARADVEARPAITGEVATTDGAPVAGADLWLVGHDSYAGRAVVLGTAKADDSGRFRLARTVDGDGGRGLGALALWAHRPGIRPARALLKYDSTSPEPTRPVRLTLAPPAEFAVRVLDPDGQSVAGAKVEVHGLRGDRTPLPDPLADRFAAGTDAAGRAVLGAATPEVVEEVRVESVPFGSQSFHFRDGLKAATDLRLRRAVPVEGRVTADDPAAVRGLKVYLTSHLKDRGELNVLGNAVAVADDRGRFAIPALADGLLYVQVEVPEGSYYRPLRVADRDFEGARRIDVAIPLRRAVRVAGTVREKGTGQPVEGAGIRFSARDAQPNSLPLARTDDRGRFVALALPGPAASMFVAAPKGYLRPMRGVAVNVADDDGQELAPIELERGRTLRGRVVDEAGQPVAGATVEGTWSKVVGPSGSNGGVLVNHPKANATTAANGEFSLEGVDPGTTVSLEAGAGEARTDGPLTASADATDPVTLRIAGDNVVALSGRVVDTSGRPVAGALVRIRATLLHASGFPDHDNVRFEGADEIRTGPDGRFRTPRQLRRGYTYRAEVQAEGAMPENTPWLKLEPATDPTFPDLPLRRIRTAGGRVCDAQGRPVAGAVVRVTGDAPKPVRAVTDAEGHFALTGVLEGTAFLFVEKPGYRFHGQSFGGGAGADVSIVRDDEPPPRPLATLPPALPRAEELGLLHRVFDTYAGRVLKPGGDAGRFEVLRLLVQVDPARVSELIGREDFADDRTRDSLRSQLGVRLVREGPDDALALIEAIGRPSSRSYALIEAASTLAEDERARKLDLLGRAVVSARAVEEPAERGMTLAGAGEGLLDLGQTDRASDVLREARSVVKGLPGTGREGFARGVVAEGLAPIDLTAALELLKGMEEAREYDQHLGHIAHELAGRDPAQAERVLMMMRDAWPHSRDDYTQRVCYRMMAVDPERAKRLAAAMKDYRPKARALGVMALALAPTDRPSATLLLAEAFRVLEQAVDEGRDQWNGLGTAGTAAAGLLPIAEQVDPRLLPESLWRTVALRPPLRGPDTRDGVADLSNAQVAAMVARYDRETARLLVDAFADRALARLASPADRDQSFHARSLFTTLAVVDPARAVALVEALPEPPDLSAERLKNAARLSVAGVLAAEGERRWSLVERSLLHLWRVDSEDF